ncbi:hypothetical protein [Pontibacter populi]|uniref:WYL domain-containing protein n=1 Tax=Pontibacter populi TaxID=890055 RepID=A0ABV1RZM5_9BACT
MLIEQLKSHGFVHGIDVHWKNDMSEFKLRPVNEEVLKTKSIIYCWFDAYNNVAMNVGLTSQTIKARFFYSSGYEKWLNGLIEKDKDRPIRYKWLDYFNQCRSGEVKIYYKPCNPALLRTEEIQMMAALRPILNVKR